MPAHIFIQGEKFTNTSNIVQWIASRTGWPVMTDSDLIRRTAEKFGMQGEKIESALLRRRSEMKRSRHRRKMAVSYLKSTLADALRTEAGIFCGMAGHLVPSKMPHVLRVLVTANTDDRIRRASSDRQLSGKAAREQIQQADRQSFQWHRLLAGADVPRDAAYDVVVPTDVLDTEAAAHLILEHLAEKANAEPESVAKTLDDFSLSARVQLTMAERGHEITVAAEDGRVRMTIERKVLFLGKKSDRIKRLVGAMPEVDSVEVAVGREYYQTDIYRRCRFEMAPAMQFEGYAKHRRQLRHSAIGSLPEDIRERPEPTIGIGRSLNL